MKRIFALILGVSISSALLSLFIEFGLHMKPCFLCSLQRYIYVSLIPLSSLGFFRFHKTARFACIALLSLSALVATYHTLIQYNLVADRCKSAYSVNTADDYKKLLAKGECSAHQLTIGDFPASLWNGVVSTALLGGLAFRKRATAL